MGGLEKGSEAQVILFFLKKKHLQIYLQYKVRGKVILKDRNGVLSDM